MKKRIVAILMITVISFMTLVCLFGCSALEAPVESCVYACNAYDDALDAYYGFRCENCHRFVHEKAYNILVKPQNVDMTVCYDCYQLYLNGVNFLEDEKAESLYSS